MPKRNGKEIECPICGKLTYFRLARLKLNAKYCSKKCYEKSKFGKIPMNLKYAQSKSPIQKGHHLVFQQGEKHWAWQKINPSYRAVHAWIVKKYGKASKCENETCVYPRKNARGHIMLAPKAYQWSNLSGKYRRDRNDFWQLCSSCHKLFDMNKL